MFYLLLFLAIILEVIAVFFLNLTNGFTNFVPTVFAILFYCSSIAAYMLLNAKGEVGVASALYAGGATVLVAVTGIIFFDETISLSKILGVSLIIIGAVSLNIKESSKERMKA
ncbi:SMR family transporter [Priestia megaterium]|uniref:DMT family transporter n=1 Tax=Priestia megaterium TaxID=1404 RepID=UPI000BFBC751|nr:SMR family transporter [Priestia megaterium]MCU7739576.1 SMR family transporter [Priestia megaterium]MCU7744958.1 SMR family transporter [Priestia megaterium]PGK22832.1 quaternary ammonium transporter [Priestia megaterium]TJZ41051.1 quaternary ammonium transporter [Priestia megaterium]WRQ94305.1 SMR family transporter [Priestia megaterium]